MDTDLAPTIATAEEVLAGLAGARDQLRRIEQGNVLLAVEWAKHHPAVGHPAAALPVGPAPSRYEVGNRVWAELAAMGCLHFDDFHVAEFAVAAGLTEYSARKLLRESLMLVHLLPRVWSRVLEDGLDVWRARALASECWGLPAEAIEYVDAQMGELTARVTQSTRERVIEDARRRFAPAEQHAADEEARGRRRVEVLFDHEESGIVPVLGELDLTDALALEAALSAGAQALKDLGSDAPLPVRRSWALGDLARAASGEGALLPFDSVQSDQRPWLAAGSADQTPQAAERPFWNGKGAFPPQVKLFVHLPAPTAAECFWCSHGGRPSGAYLEGRGTPGTKVFDAETVKEWFTRPTLAGGFAPPVSIRSVLNMRNYYDTNSYKPPDRLRDQVQLRSTTCIFPFCTASARKCDADHNEPWKSAGAGGATCSCNLAPLCRRHHRLKTHCDEQRSAADAAEGQHARWEYAHLGEDEYYWRGPRGLGFIRTNRGTYEAAGGGATGAPLHRAALRTHAGRARLAEETIERLLEAARGRVPEDQPGLVELRFAPGETVPLTPAEEEGRPARMARSEERHRGWRRTRASDAVSGCEAPSRTRRVSKRVGRESR